MFIRRVPQVTGLIKRCYSTGRPFSTTILPSMLDDVIEETEDLTLPKSYKEIPGPKELPFIGNSWRFAPFVGR